MYHNHELSNLIDRVFGFEPYGYQRSSYIKRSSDDASYELNQTKDGAYLLFEAPGFNKNNLKVELEDGILYIRGSRKYKLNGEEMTKKIDKQFRLDSDYNVDLIEATIEDGLLQVFVPGYQKKEKKKISLI